MERRKKKKWEDREKRNKEVFIQSYSLENLFH